MEGGQHGGREKMNRKGRRILNKSFDKLQIGEALLMGARRSPHQFHEYCMSPAGASDLQPMAEPAS